MKSLKISSRMLKLDFQTTWEPDKICSELDRREACPVAQSERVHYKMEY